MIFQKSSAIHYILASAAGPFLSSLSVQMLENIAGPSD